MYKNQVINQNSTLEQLSGIVKRITYHNSENGWTVLKITPFNHGGEEVAVIIHQSKVFAGATMDFYGNWVNHPKYGAQFKAVKSVEKKPASANALEKYLGSGLIKGVGPVTAKRIVKHFGQDTLKIFDKHIEKLTEVPGIAQLKLQMIQKAWEEHKEIRDVMIFLQQYDISTLFAVKIFKTYGKNAIKIVSENPYRLAEDIYGIGFLSADKIALSMNIEEDSEIRLKAAINHILASSREEGHCFLTQEQILKGVNELLNLDLDLKLNRLLANMEEKDEIKVRDLSDQGKGKYYYDNSIYYDEMYIAEKINKLKNNHYQTNEERVEQWIKNFCQKKDIVLSTGQYDAVKNIVSQGFSILTGGPGCGKTTTTRVLVMLLLAMKKKVFLCAPTGRAAQRMTDVIGVEAKTIHRLLEWDISNGGFKKKQSNELDCSFLIVDECSMLDVHLAAALLRAVKNKAQVIFIGDADQLPSVGAGNIFKDIISSEVVPVYRLTEVFRQAKESSIIRHAHQINSGFVPRIESPFYRPQLWQESEDCLFIDSDEATQEQLSFVKKVKYLAEKRRTYKVQEKKDAEKYFNKDKDNSIDKIHESLYTEDEEISIPDKFQHVNIEQLMDAKSSTEELRYILKKVHPWSSLNYGYTALPIIEKIYTQTIPKYFGKNAEIQILTPMTRGSLGTISLNKVIQEKANPLRTGISQIQLGDRIFRIGDRVIQKRNNYDLDVFNGDIGIIRSVDTENLNLSIEFKTGLNHKVVHYEKDSLAEIDLAYAITIHKSQGSEFEFIIIPLFTQHFSMLFRNLVYTGLTRAKKMAIFVGNRKALSMSVRNNKTKVRQTTLDFLLKQTSID